MDYEAKIDGKLGDIAKTVGKLEDSIDKYHDSDSRPMRYFEQKKALHEIKTILRKSDDIEQYHRWQDTEDIDINGMHVEDEDSGFTHLSPTESNEDVTLDRINTQLMHLDDTLDHIDENGNVRSYVEQKRALHEIKKILHDAGRYDSYRANELDDLDILYTIQ